MKLAMRISSMRRMAWKQCRSCSADSDSMCRDSLAKSALAGWMRSFSAASTRVTGSCASQSISRSGTQLAQLARDREIALGVTEPDGRRDVERASPAASALRRGTGFGGHAKSRSARLTATGLRHCGAMPAVGDGHECAAGRLGQLFAVAVREDPVVRRRG